MKKLLATAMVAVTVVGAWAQGTVNFANYFTVSTPQILAITYDVDGVTRLNNAYAADLFYGAPGSDPSTWQSAGVVSVYRTGTAAGRLTPQEVALPGVPGGSVIEVQLRAWRLSDGASWQAALASASPSKPSVLSPVTAPSVVVRTGNPNAVPPGVPADLIDINTGLALAGHSLVQVVPEPSTILLGLAGLGGLLYLRRRKA
jgi:hypothetical protein